MNPMFTRLTLGVAGLLALGIGTAIAFLPDAFYASYGIVFPVSADLYSELRAPGANLTVLGTLIFMGVLKSGWTRFSAALGTTVFLAYAAGRIVSIVLDGMPSEPIFLALVIELAIGGLCAQVLWCTGRQKISRGSLSWQADLPFKPVQPRSGPHTDAARFGLSCSAVVRLATANRCNPPKNRRNVTV